MRDSTLFGTNVCKRCGTTFEQTARQRGRRRQYCTSSCAWPKPDWHAAAHSMRNDGETVPAIAAKLGKTVACVRNALYQRARNRLLERLRYRDVKRVLASIPAHTHRLTSSEWGFCETHTPRVPRKIIDRDAIGPATRAFAAGQITRDEMMARIRGRAG